MLNTESGSTKVSQVERLTNRFIKYILIIQFCLCAFCALMSYLGTQDPPDYLPPREDPGGDSLLNYLSYFLLLNTMVPISLVVSMEVVKLCQMYFISRDLCMTRSVPKTRSINEEPA